MQIRAIIDENNGRWKEDLIHGVFSPREVIEIMISFGGLRQMVITKLKMPIDYVLTNW
jgi:hypothetical protein